MAEARVEVKVRMSQGLYDLLMASKGTGESVNAAVLRALESALGNGTSLEEPSRVRTNQTASPPAQTRTPEESELPTQDDAPSKEGPDDQAGIRTSAPRRSTYSKSSPGTRPTVDDSTEKKEAASSGPNPESGDEAVAPSRHHKQGVKPIPKGGR